MGASGWIHCSLQQCIIIHAYKHTCMHAHTNTHTHRLTHAETHTCMHAHTNTHAHRPPLSPTPPHTCIRSSTEWSDIPRSTAQRAVYISKLCISLDTHSLPPLQQRTLDGQSEAETPPKRGKWPPQSGTSLLEQLKVEMKALSKEFKVGCSFLCVRVCVCVLHLWCLVIVYSIKPFDILCLKQLHWFNLQTTREPPAHIKSILLNTDRAGFSAFNI